MADATRQPPPPPPPQGPPPQQHRAFGVGDADLAAAGAMLRAGGCVAFPTETVYGLGANALDERAVLDVFKFKGRPLTDPLIVHVPTAEQALALLVLTPAARAVAAMLAARFWPGPLTLVGQAVPSIPLTVTAGTGFVGVRVPAHPVALRLLAAARVPVAAPSANRFGHVSPTTAAHVVADLGHALIGVVVGEGAPGGGGGGGGGAGQDTCAVGIESTVVKVEEVALPPAAPRDLEAAGDAAADHGAAAAVAAMSSSLIGPPATAQHHDVRLVVYRRGGVSVGEMERAIHEALAGRATPAQQQQQQLEGLPLQLRVLPVEYRTLHRATPPPLPGSASPDAAAAAAAVPGDGVAAAVDAVATAAAAAAATLAQPASEAAAPARAAIEGGAEAPGMLLSHYAPDVDAYMVAGAGAVDAAAPPPAPFDRALLPRTVVIDVGGQLAGLRAAALAYEDLSATGSMTEARARLFAALRWAERVPGAGTVLLADPAALRPTAPDARRGAGPVDGWEHADALRDRMFRAASGRLVAVPV